MTLQERIAKLLEEQPRTTVAKLSAKSGVSINVVATALQKGITSGIFAREKPPKTPYIYSLVKPIKEETNETNDDEQDNGAFQYMTACKVCGCEWLAKLQPSTNMGATIMERWQRMTWTCTDCGTFFHLSNLVSSTEIGKAYRNIGRRIDDSAIHRVSTGL